MVLATAAVAETKEEQAQAFIRVLSDQALELVSNRDLSRPERREKFRDLLSKSFDMNWIGQFVLGRSWLLATPEQRDEYLRLFRESIVFTYSNRFEDYSGQKVRVTGNRKVKSRYVFVTSEIYDPIKARSVVNVMWRLLPKSEGFRIVDVVIEGVSMGVTQRNEYASVIQRNGGKVQALIDALRENVARMQAEDES